MDTPKHQHLIEQGEQLSRDIESLMRQEMNNGHLSPTDSLVLQRASSFLRKTLRESLEGPKNSSVETQSSRKQI